MKREGDAEEDELEDCNKRLKVAEISVNDVDGVDDSDSDSESSSSSSSSSLSSSVETALLPVEPVALPDVPAQLPDEPAQLPDEPVLSQEEPVDALEQDDKMTDVEKGVYENILQAQATRDDLLRILQFPPQQLVEEKNLNIRSRDESVIDLFVRIHVKWDAQDLCIVARAEAFEECEAYTVVPGGWGKPKPVNQKLRVRRGTQSKLFPLDIFSNSPVTEKEFRCWYDWVSEENLEPTPDSLALTKHRLAEARAFKFDTHIIDALIASKGKKGQISQQYRQAKATVESLRFQLQSGVVHSRDIPATTALLRKAERDFEIASERYLKMKDAFEENNTRLYGISAVNNRNIAKQENLDRAVAKKSQDILLHRAEVKLNPFSRRDCKPVVMWDVGKASNANINGSS